VGNREEPKIWQQKRQHLLEVGAQGMEKRKSRLGRSGSVRKHIKGSENKTAKRRQTQQLHRVSSMSMRPLPVWEEPDSCQQEDIAKIRATGRSGEHNHNSGKRTAGISRAKRKKEKKG